MHRAIQQQATFTNKQTRVLTGRHTGLDKQAANDAPFQEQLSTLQGVLMVLGNVIGGSLLLTGMFLLPQLITLIFVSY